MGRFGIRFRPRSLELFNGSYNREQFGTDIGAGVTVGLIALPLALALGVASCRRGSDSLLAETQGGISPTKAA